MNVFTTDHAFDYQSEAKKPGLRSYFSRVLLVALILAPLFTCGFWLSDVTDNGGSTGGYTPAPFWADLLAAVAVSVFIAFAGAGVCFLFASLFRKFSRSS